MYQHEDMTQLTLAPNLNICPHGSEILPYKYFKNNSKLLLNIITQNKKLDMNKNNNIQMICVKEKILDKLLTDIKDKIIKEEKLIMIPKNNYSTKTMDIVEEWVMSDMIKCLQNQQYPHQQLGKEHQQNLFEVYLLLHQIW